MAITRLNHAVLYVREIKASVDFYTTVLGFRKLDMLPDGFDGAAFLQAEGSDNDHDLGLFEIGVDARPSMAGRTNGRALIILPGKSTRWQNSRESAMRWPPLAP